MIIPLSADWRVTSDRYCWTLQRNEGRVEKSTGKVAWDNMGYFPTASSAIEKYAEHVMRMSPAEGLVEAIREVERLSGELARLLEIAHGYDHRDGA